VHKIPAMRTRATIVGILLFAGLIPQVNAQWLNYRDPRTPRTKDGKPDLIAPAPRLNGKPDFSGLWLAERATDREYEAVLGKSFTSLQVDTYDISKYALNVFWGIKPEEEPLRPEAAAIYKQRQGRPDDYPHVRCLPGGIPIALMVFTFKIIQTPHEIVMLSESADPPREIHTDGRPLPKDPNPTWMGYAVGRWEGDTLVIETSGFTDRAWIDAFGHPRSESMHITEKYRRRDFGHMDMEITFNDPTFYTRPFGFKTQLNLIPDSDLLEYVCAENEKDRARLGK
jgi:hypothetical protein